MLELADKNFKLTMINMLMLKDLTEMVDNTWGISGGKKETQKELHGKSKKEKLLNDTFT